ncbi:MAG: hypothetical protein Q8P50_04925 [Bacillota bacterium]|nr:hypothetical protein [Bacillota bacterium]
MKASGIIVGGGQNPGHPRRDAPRLQEPIRAPARLDWHEVTKVAHYYLSVDAMIRPMQMREGSPPYGGKE